MNLLVKVLFLLCIWDYRRHMRKAQAAILEPSDTATARH